MAEPSLAYAPAIDVEPGIVHPTPDDSPGPLRLREKRHDCVQLAGFGAGRDLAAWLEETVGACAAPGAAVPVLNQEALLLATGPATWLLVAEPGRLAGFPPGPKDGLHAIAALTDFSDGRSVAFELRGPAAAQVLAMHLGLDLDEAGFAPGRCAATGIHAMQVVVARREPDVFLVLVQRSFAASLWEILLDSALSYGAVVDPAAS